MHGVGQQILSGPGIAGNQQRRGQAGKLAGLIDHMTHFRADGNDLAERSHILAGEILQLTAHPHGRAQHDNGPGQNASVVLSFQVHRCNLHQEILPVDHHMLAMRILRVAVQPALEIKPRDQLRGMVMSELVLALGEQLAARMVYPLNFAFQIQ